MPSRRHRLGILAICCSSLLIVGLDITAMNVALPAIGDDLGADISGLQWTVSAYTVVMASLLMFAGSIADRVGRKRVFLTGLAVFLVASVLCSLAPDVGWLVGFRVLQATGASMMNPVAMSIITNTFTDPGERAQAVGVWGAVFGVAMALGPLAGGALVSSAGWRSIFWINVPVALVAILLTLRFVPESKARRARRFDPAGQGLVLILLTTLTYGIIEAPSQGWTAASTVAVLGASAVSLLALLVHESRRHEPLVDLRLFRSAPFSSAIVISVTAFAVFGGFLFLSTLYLQDVRGLSPVETGVAMMPMALMTIVASPLSGRVVGRRGTRVPLTVAGVCFVGACGLLATSNPGTPYWLLMIAYAVFGTGFGFVNAPITNTAVSGMPRDQAGVASALATTSRQVGQTLGVAAVGALASGWWMLVACGAVVLVLGLAATTQRAARSASRAARLPDPEEALAA